MGHLKNLTQRFLLARGIYLGSTVDPAAIQQLLSAVKPVQTNHDLIRVGGDLDGGYLVPNDFIGVKACFSPGVSTVADFETDLARRGIRCFLADASVDAPPIENPLFDFERKLLGSRSDVQFMTLESWIQQKDPSGSDFILQMDIEGAEYCVIIDTPREVLQKFRIIVVEFHHLDRVCERAGFELVFSTFNKLLKDFEVVHVHPNNRRRSFSYRQFEIPPLMEFTFLRKDRISTRRPYLEFPNQLDRKNVPQREDLVLPRCWYA